MSLHSGIFVKNYKTVMEPKVRFVHRDCAFDRRISTFAIVNITHCDIRDFLEDAFIHFERAIYDILLEHKIVKVNAVFSAVLEKQIAAIDTQSPPPPPHSNFDVDEILDNSGGLDLYDAMVNDLLRLPESRDISQILNGVLDIEEESESRAAGGATAPTNTEAPSMLRETQTLHINSSSQTVHLYTNLRRFFENSVKLHILARFDEAALHGSGFTLSTINELSIQVNKYDPICGGIGSTYKDTPNFLKFKGAIVNVKNKDYEF